MRIASRKHVPQPLVLVFAGGGLSHVAGGVGTLLRYMMAVWARDPASLPVRVIDTRGPGGAASAAAHFAHGILALLWGRLSGQACCAHIHMTTRGSAWRKAVLCALSRIIGMPSVLHLHGADFFDFCQALPWPARRLLRACIAEVGCIVVIGRSWRDRLIDELAIPAERIRVVPNGVPAAPRASGGRGPARILFLGRLGSRKGVPELVRALSGPRMTGRAWTAMIAGDGEAESLMTAVAAADLQARIDMPGWLGPEQAAEALAQADILVLPSHHEVMPIAILEAMARGLAIVATPVGVIPEILEHCVNAWLVPPGDADALARALAALIDEPALRQRLGNQARLDFGSRLDVRIPACELQAIFRDVSAAPGRLAYA